MSKDDDFNLIHEMARGCLYRGGESEANFLKGYRMGGIFWISFLVIGYGLEVFLKWLF